MSVKRFSLLIALSIMAFGFILIGCDADSSYDQRTVVYVSNVNEGGPYTSDVLNQGDSLYYAETTTIKYVDDYIEEDWVTVEFSNRPYNGILDVESGAHGDFLVTSYDVEYVAAEGAPTPVASFTGETSVLVPANSSVEAAVMLVPFRDKNRSPLIDIQYTSSEILANAQITFHGHEIQSGYDISFQCGLFVGFADLLNEEDQN